LIAERGLFELCEDVAIGLEEILVVKDPAFEGVLQQLCEEDVGGVVGGMHEELGVEGDELFHQLPGCLFVGGDDPAVFSFQAVEDLLDVFLSDHIGFPQVSEAVVDPVGAELWKWLFKSREVVFVEDVRGIEAVSLEDRFDLAVFDELLEVVFVEVLVFSVKDEVGDMGECGVWDIVDECGDLLLTRTA